MRKIIGGSIKIKTILKAYKIMNKWTSSQLSAINVKGRCTLVSAAAGSGKTAVLIERIIKLITSEKSPCEIDKILVVTFTKAAASQMKQRLSDKLDDLIDKDPNNQHLLKQKTLLPCANISTVHSFCSFLIKENFYELNLNPDFSVASTQETHILKNKAMSNVLNTKHQQGSSVFYKLLKTLGCNKNDRPLKTTIFTLYEFIRSHPFPQFWIEDKLKMYDPTDSMMDNPFASTLLLHAKNALGYVKNLTINNIQLVKGEEPFEEAYTKTFECDLKILEDLENTLSNSTWDDFVTEINTCKLSTLKRVVGFVEDPIKIAALKNRKLVKSTLEALQKLFFCTQDDFNHDNKALKELAEELFGILKSFDKTFKNLKLEKNLLDYGDLEHYTIKLLWRADKRIPKKTPHATKLSKLFKYIMIDEYQDTNQIQDMIFAALSPDEKNIFMVGDIKQSIYSFRQADPKIFLNKKDSFLSFKETEKLCSQGQPNPSSPVKITLEKNFRSNPKILDFVNFVFKLLLTKEAGDMDYLEEDRLFCGKNDLTISDSNKKDPDVELKIIDFKKAEDILTNEEKLTSIVSDLIKEEESSNEVDLNDMDLVEASYIASKIKHMVDEKYQIIEKNITRPVEYKDFCVMLRSTKNHANTFVKELKKNGIPAFADTTENFLGTPEILCITSFLKSVENPLQDEFLLATLLSPAFGFTLDEIVEIRHKDLNSPLLDCVRAHVDSNHRCNNYIKALKKYTTLSRTLTICNLIQEFYDEFLIPNYFLAIEQNQKAYLNLMLLLEYANEFCEKDNPYPFNFVSYINELEKQEVDLPPAKIAENDLNVVSVMSIHKSKGLEFPVCFLANCSRKFNKDRGEILLHPELGIGIKLLNEEKKFRYNTLCRESVTMACNNAQLSEEIRVLYVALTRAKQKLILVSSHKDLEKYLNKLDLKLAKNFTLPPYTVKKGSCFSDWIIPCATMHPDGKSLRKMITSEFCKIVDTCSNLSVKIIKSEHIFKKLDKTSALVQNQKTAAKDFKTNKIEENLLFFEELSRLLPAARKKISVTDLVDPNHKNSSMVFKTPNFLVHEKNKNAQTKGSAMHKFLQHCDFESSINNPLAEIKLLKDKNILAIEEVQCLDVDALHNFFKNDLAKRICSSHKILREYPFTVRLFKEDINDSFFDDVFFNQNHLILNGAIDCAFLEDEQYVILDYKTDKINLGHKVNQKYLKQIHLYKLALKKCTQVNVKECGIYFFDTGELITL